MHLDGFRPFEDRVLRRLDSPEKIQRFLDIDVAYNKERHGATCRSPRRVLAVPFARVATEKGPPVCASAWPISSDPELEFDMKWNLLEFTT